MSRPLRIEYPGAVYHVMNRGNAAQKIFNSRKNYELFLTLLDETVALLNIEIYAFSLMPNHYHLLLSTPEANLSRAMRHINSVYTQRYNRYWKRDGHLFRGRYKAILVDEDAYLVELMRYIHLNPVQAKIVKKPQDHQWTSHRHYLGEEEYEWLSTARLLSYFGRRKNLARRKMHEFVLERVPDELQKRLDSKKWPSVLSSKNFRKWVEWNFVKDRDDREISYVRIEPKYISEVKLKKIMTGALEIGWNELCDAKGREAKRKRRLAVRCFQKYLKWSYDKISELFGGMHSSNISRCVQGDWVNAESLWERLEIEIQNEKRKT